MSKLLALLWLLPAHALVCKPISNTERQLMQIKQIIEHTKAKHTKIPKRLPAEILRASKQYGVDPLLVTRIMAVESKFNQHAHNKATNDYGLMQINGGTAILLGISKQCLHNWRCNLYAGALILSRFDKYFGAKETNWYCRYNVGTAKLVKVNKNCTKYVNKLVSIGG